jgi:benzylsuccinate CoA-transferase BbsF subunit
MSRHGVLAGIRVVDFTWVWAGPIIGRHLADYGAEVITVENGDYLDLARQLHYKDGVADPDMAVAFTNYNAGKKSLTLNMAMPEAISIIKRLLAMSDILVESMTPRAMRKWGLSYEELCRIKPDIIMLSTCMQGQTGPYCMSPGNGAMGAAAVMTALVHRQRTGEGQYIDMSQNECAMHFITTAFLDYSANGRIATRLGNQRPGFAPHGVYGCQGDDAWCTIAVRTEPEWHALCEVMGHPPWTRDSRFTSGAAREAHSAALEAQITAWTSQLPAQDVMARLQRTGVPAAVVHNAQTLDADLQLAHRQHYARLQHPRIGRNVIDNYGFRLSATPGRVESSSPLLGQHNAYVLGELLGLSSADIARLQEAGVVA